MKLGRTIGWQVTLGTAVAAALAAGALSPFVLRAAPPAVTDEVT